MKKISGGVQQHFNRNEITTDSVKDNGTTEIKSGKSFTCADLWNIQRSGKIRSFRKYL